MTVILLPSLLFSCVVRYPYSSSPTGSSLHLCNNFITSSHLISSLTITGQGVVSIDCGNQVKFLKAGIAGTNAGRIVNIRLENLNVKGGVSSISLFI